LSLFLGCVVSCDISQLVKAKHASPSEVGFRIVSLEADGLPIRAVPLLNCLVRHKSVPKSHQLDFMLLVFIIVLNVTSLENSLLLSLDLG
jgi:hypothetical protein